VEPHVTRAVCGLMRFAVTRASGAEWGCVQAVARIAELRSRLREDHLIQHDADAAVHALMLLGIPEGRARQEAERVPPLPAARFVRPAVFLKSREADQQMWYAPLYTCPAPCPTHLERLLVSYWLHVLHQRLC
jgi:hypothetical protein